MRAALQFRRLSCEQSQVGFVHQGRTLQSVIRPFGLQMVVSEPPQFFVDQGQKIAQGFFVALLPVLRQLGNLTGPIFRHRPTSGPFPDKATSIFVPLAPVNRLRFTFR